MTNRLVVFGCSYTYGHGFSDCFDPKTRNAAPIPSKLNYPNMISKMINKKVVNLSSPGASNKEIALKINNFDFDPSDTVIVQWTHINRYCISEAENLRRIVVTDDADLLTETYYKYIHNEHDSLVCTDLYIDYAYCKLKEVEKSIFIKPLGANDDDYWKKYEYITRKSLWDFTIDKADDGCHPGIESHKLFSNYLVDTFL